MSGAPWLALPSGGHGLGEPACAGLASVEHPGCGLLRRGAHEVLWPATACWRSSEQPVHQLRLHRVLAGDRCPDLKDGGGRCLDNIFLERLWHSLEYEAVYLRELANGFQSRCVIGEWIGFYNTERPHSALGARTPAEVYRGGPPVVMMDNPLLALPLNVCVQTPQAQYQRQEDRFKGFLTA